MKTEYVQRLVLHGDLVTITYSYRETWQRLLNGHMQPPVVVKLYPKTIKEQRELIAHFAQLSDDIVFIIREYLSVVQNKFEGIRFQYELINHAIKLSEEDEKIDYYRAELKWAYND